MTAVLAFSAATVLALASSSHAAVPAAPAAAPAGQTLPPAPGTLASALEAARTSDYPRAERELGAIRGAELPVAQLALARVLADQGKFADAERVAHLVSSNPTQKAHATAIRAEVLWATGKRQDAIKALEAQQTASGPGGRRVRLLLGEYRISSGHRSDADEPLLKIVEEYNSGGIPSTDAEGLAMVGRAAHLLRSPKDANQAFNESERVDKHRFETLLWRSELFLEKYDPGHADEAVKEALSIAPKHAASLVLQARVKLDQALDFDAAEKLVKDALAVNPKITGAFAVRAGLALRDMDLAAADAAVAAGLAINPNDLELWSLRAATRFLNDDRTGYEAAKKETFARNAEFAKFYEIVGEYAEWEHRYDDIVTMMKEATALDPEDGKAWAELGITQMRGGDETAGLASLQTAWKKDHYNVRNFNTLNLYEQTIPTAYEMGTEGAFKIRYPKDEKKVLERYVPRLLAEAWGSMKARYAFVPQNPVQVEMYSNREQFSVRTSGLPNIGIQGVCFGRVVAAMSPKSEPFNWGNVVWHELGHVFAIQLSKNHVPRWFTEGLSEYETIARRPEWQRELDPELYAALKKNALPGAVDMNRAFTHASDSLDVTVAYYAASQMLVFTVDTFGMGKVTEALKLWGQGIRTPQVIQRAFGVSAADYDARYRTWQMARLSRFAGQFFFHDQGKPLDESKALVAASPNDASAHVALGLSLLRARKIPEAKQELDAALKIDPGTMPAHFLLSKIAGGEHDAAGQISHLVAIQKAGGDGYMVQMALAEIAEEKKDKAARKTALEAAFRFDPSQSEPLKGLYELAKEQKRDADELDVLRKLAFLEQHDRRAWQLLMDKLVAEKKWDEAKKAGEAAIFVDVENAALHTNYARALGALNLHDKAVFELESALLCAAPAKDQATAHALLATELLALKNPGEARKHLAEASRLDPTNAEAKAVKVP